MDIRDLSGGPGGFRAQKVRVLRRHKEKQKREAWMEREDLEMTESFGKV